MSGPPSSPQPQTEPQTEPRIESPKKVSAGKVIVCSGIYVVFFWLLEQWLFKEHGAVATGLSIAFMGVTLLLAFLLVVKPEWVTPEKKKRKGEVAWLLHSTQMSLALTILFLAFFENSRPGRYLAAGWMNEIRNVLPYSQQLQKSGVVVIDMSGLPTIPEPGGNGSVTDIAKLSEFIRLVGNPENAAIRPKCIGIDLNFRKEDHDSIRPDTDIDFLEDCLELGKTGRLHGRGPNRPLPICVSSQKGWQEPAEYWLPHSKFAPIATCIELSSRDVTRMWGRVWRNGGEPPAGKVHNIDLNHLLPLRSLGQWLADAAAESPHIPGLSEWHPMTLGEIAGVYQRQNVPPPESNRSKPQQFAAGDGVEAETVLVDYRYLPILENASPIESYLGAGSKSKRKDLKDQIVLIGDVSRVDIGDSFAVPGYDKTYSGVLLHASLAATLHNNPLFELNSSTRIAMDILLSYGPLFLIMLAIQRQPKNKKPNPSWMAFGEKLVPWVPLFISVILALFFHILWPEAVLMTFSMIVHPMIEHGLEGMSSWWNSNAYVEDIPQESIA